jgi:hypothetical protein
VRRVDALLRITLGLGWILMALASVPAPPAPLADGLLAGVLILAALAVLGGVIPRTATLAGLALSLTLALDSGPLWAAILGLGAGLARLDLLAGSSGTWLSRLRRLSRVRTLHLAATEFARARAARSRSKAERLRVLRDAGDAYERAGRAREARRLLGAPQDPGAALTGFLARALAAALGRVPRLQRRIERRLAAASRRRTLGT